MKRTKQGFGEIGLRTSENGTHTRTPLSPSQKQALALARNEPERYPLRPSQTVRVDATAGGRYQGFRVP